MLRRQFFSKYAAGGLEQMNHQNSQQADLNTNDQGQAQQSTAFMDYDEAMGETLQVMARSANQAYELHSKRMAEKAGQTPFNQAAPKPQETPPALQAKGQSSSENGTLPPTQQPGGFAQNNRMSKAARWDILMGGDPHPSVQTRPVPYIRMLQR